MQTKPVYLLREHNKGLYLVMIGYCMLDLQALHTLCIEAGWSRLAVCLTGSVMNNGPEAVRMLGPACF